MLRLFSKAATHGKWINLNSRNSLVRWINIFSPNAYNPAFRLIKKPVLVEEDSTDDEYDDDLNLKKTQGANEETDSELDDGDEPLPQKRIGREILKLGRVNYRVPEILPEWLAQRKEQISENRTPNQIRRCIKNWMLKPDRELQQKYAEKEVGWSNTAPHDAGKEASRVMSYGPDETIAYVNYFMPSRYVITRRVMNELKEFLPKFRPRRIFDFGCGPGTCAAAAADVWGHDKIERYVGVDMSQSMLDAAKIVTTSMGHVNPTKSNSAVKKNEIKSNYVPTRKGPDVILTTKTADVIGRIAAAKDDNQRFDMAIAAYTLSELTSDSIKRAAVQILFESLDNNGVLVIIDNGSPIGSHHTRSARQMLLDLFGNKVKSPQSDQHRDPNPTKNIEIKYVLKPVGSPRFTYEDYEISVIAPCTHDGMCPLRPGAWCSFPQRAQSSMIRSKNEEKFSYVVLQKKLKISAHANHSEDVSLINNAEDYWLTHVADPRLLTADPTPLNIVERFLHYPHQDTNPLAEKLMEEVDFDDYNPPLVRREYGRILRSPIKKKEHVIMDLCQSDGFLTRTTISKSSAWNIPHFYSAIRKLRWGGIVPILPVSVHDISAHEELKKNEQMNDKKNDRGYQPILVISPLARRRPSSSPPVRRDIHPPAKVEKNIFGYDEGPQKGHERNRDARDTGIELYQVDPRNQIPDPDYSKHFEDTPSSRREDAEFDEIFESDRADSEAFSKYLKSMETLIRNPNLLEEEAEKEDNDDPNSEKLPGWDSSSEDISEDEQERLLNMTDEDWKEWDEILDGNPTIRTTKKKNQNDNDEGEAEMGKFLEGKRNKISSSISSTVTKGRKGTSQNEALQSKLPTKSHSPITEKSSSRAPASPPSPPSSSSSSASSSRLKSQPQKTEGRKKPPLVARRTKKTDGNE